MRALVTGAASGLGEALTRALRARGDEVLATDVAGMASLVEEVAQQPSRDHGNPGFETLASASSSTNDAEGDVVSTPLDRREGGGEIYRLDITSDADWAGALTWVEEHWGGLDLLVNNAGVAGGGRVDVAGLDEWEWITEINLFGVVRACRTFVPMLKRQRSGRIVNVASLAGLVHPAGMASYNAVKAGVVALTETLGHELSPYDVQASVVCPSYFRTNLLSSMRGNDTALAGIVSHLVESSPISADDIAAAVLAGIDAGDEIILPDPAARKAYELKLADRPAYDAMMRKQAAALDRLD